MALEPFSIVAHHIWTPLAFTWLIQQFDFDYLLGMSKITDE